jgi:hypothetical protein
VFCQYLSCQYFSGGATRVGTQAATSTGAALTIILIVLFAVCMAAGLLIMVGTRKNAHQGAADKKTPTRSAIRTSIQPPGQQAAAAPQTKPDTGLPARNEDAMPAEAQNGRRQTPPLPADRPHGLQAIIDIMGEGIETGLSGIDTAIFYIVEAFVKVFKWIFRIEKQ